MNAEPAAARAELLELRVHGVSGGTPGDMLGHGPVELVAGDRQAGFYREVGSAAQAGSKEQDGVRRRVEAYSWGGLTSGAAARAFWLLLLPFMLSNVAYWMRPLRAGTHRTLDRSYSFLARVVAFSLTAELVLATAGVALDLVGWQCAGEGRACGRSRSYLRFLTTDGGWWEQPGRRLAVTAIVPLALVAGVWYLARRTWSTYEAQEPPDPGRAGPTAGETNGLADPGFWRGTHSVRRLRSLHLALGISTVACVLVWPTLAFDRDHGAGRAALGWSVVGLLAATAATSIGLIGIPRFTERRPSRMLDLLAYTCAAAAALAAVAAVTDAMLSRPEWTSTGRLPGFAGVVTGLFTAQVAALMLFALVTAVIRARSASPGALSGFAGPAVATLGWLIGGAFSAGVTFRMADWLDGNSTPAADLSQPGVQPPVVYAWGAFGFAVEVAVVVGLALLLGYVVVRRRRRAVATVRQVYGTESRTDRLRTKRIATAYADGRLVELAPAFVLGVLLPAGLVALAMTVGYTRGLETPQELVADAPAFWDATVSFMLHAGSWLIGIFALSLIALGRAAYGDGHLRRTVGILWDLGTFWPRAAHPLAPPCYAERTVPDLLIRMQPVHAGGGRVVLSGHSQGSVLAAAAVYQLPRDEARQTALLTYGSPLRRLYTRFFPAYFGVGQVEELRSRTPWWRNLWRRTDPIGGPTGLEGIDVELPDPSAFGRPPGDPTYPPIRGHSGYLADPAYTTLVREAESARDTAEPMAVATQESSATGS